MRAGLCVLQGQTHWEDASPAPRALSQGPAGRRREERRGEKSREERRREEKPSRQRSGETPTLHPVLAILWEVGSAAFAAGRLCPPPHRAVLEDGASGDREMPERFPCKHAVYSSYTAVL